jgi:hypothetical protein
VELYFRSTVGVYCVVLVTYSILAVYLVHSFFNFVFPDPDGKRLGSLCLPAAGMRTETVKTFVFCDVRHVLRCIVGGTVMRVLTSSALLHYHSFFSSPLLSLTFSSE